MKRRSLVSTAILSAFPLALACGPDTGPDPTGATPDRGPSVSAPPPRNSWTPDQDARRTIDDSERGPSDAAGPGASGRGPTGAGYGRAPTPHAPGATGTPADPAQRQQNQNLASSGQASPSDLTTYDRRLSQARDDLQQLQRENQSIPQDMEQRIEQAERALSEVREQSDSTGRSRLDEIEQMLTQLEQDLRNLQ